MKFDYKTVFGPLGFQRIPLVEVVFQNPKESTEVTVLGLVDSGAGGILLNAEFADVLGMTIEEGKPHPYQGIAGDPVVGYDHMLRLHLKQDRSEYVVSCSFVPGLNTACLLGQDGFFANYKIVFEYQKGSFELTPLPSQKGRTM